MPIGGKLVLKGGQKLEGIEKKKKKSKKKTKVLDGLEQPAGEGKPADGAAPSSKTYEQEFSLEIEKMKEGKVKSTPWGSSYKPAPEILHGYTTKVSGRTAEERLDMRAAQKSDKFCK